MLDQSVAHSGLRICICVFMFFLYIMGSGSCQMVFYPNGGEAIKPENGNMLKLLAEKKKITKLMPDRR